MNKKLDPCKIFSLGVAGEDSAPNLNFSKLLELSETSRAIKFILGLQVNIDKANSRRYDVTLYMVYREPRKDPQAAYYCTVCIVWI